MPLLLTTPISLVEYFHIAAVAALTIHLYQTLVSNYLNGY